MVFLYQYNQINVLIFEANNSDQSVVSYISVYDF